uniref:non-specific serine/threonine protein kinase n=1 Tax=Otolemur garnettii TaxID=30611 RepID=H0XP34_OTOGA
QQQKNSWVPVVHGLEEFKPFVEPELDISDQKRIDILVKMGYSQEEIEESLSKMKHDEIIPYSCCLRENFQSFSQLDSSDSSSSGSLPLARIRPSSGLSNNPGQSQARSRDITMTLQKGRKESREAGPAIPSVVAYPKRSQTNTKDSDHKEDGIPSQISRGIAVGREGIAPANPMLGDASLAPEAQWLQRQPHTPRLAGSNLALGHLINNDKYVCVHRYVLGTTQRVFNYFKNVLVEDSKLYSAPTHSISSATSLNQIHIPRGLASHSTFH